MKNRTFDDDDSVDYFSSGHRSRFLRTTQIRLSFKTQELTFFLILNFKLQSFSLVVV